MAIDRPSIKPDWATTTVAVPDVTKVVEPPLSVKDDGSPSGSVNPIRTFSNWFKNITWQWLTWLDQVYRRTDDLHPDQAIPTFGSVPGTGAGLGPIAAGDFSAVVYVNGYRVGDNTDVSGAAQSPIHTYSALSDTYWDLGQDCVWTPVVVANGAGEPALTADSVRVYVVVTDAIDRTGITDRRETSLQIDKPIEFSSTFTWPDMDTIVDDYELRQTYPNADASAGPIRLYIKNDSVTGHSDVSGSRLVLTGNAAWNQGTTMWDRDVAGDAFSVGIGDVATLQVFTHSSADAASWTDTNTATTWNRYVRLDPSQLVLDVNLKAEQTGLNIGDSGLRWATAFLQTLNTSAAAVVGTTVTAGTGVIATTGDVTATAGNVVATAGDVEATVGEFVYGTTRTFLKTVPAVSMVSMDSSETAGSRVPGATQMIPAGVNDRVLAPVILPDGVTLTRTEFFFAAGSTVTVELFRHTTGGALTSIQGPTAGVVLASIGHVIDNSANSSYFIRLIDSLGGIGIEGLQLTYDTTQVHQ